MSTYIAKAPSNIAFLKYWGKANEEQQWPANDSISMTLDLFTETRVQASEQYHFSWNGQTQDPSHPFWKKPLAHLENIARVYGFESKLNIDTHNHFPTGCGIASSASGLAALTLGALACWTQSDNLQTLAKQSFGLDQLSALAREGSGSACRSFWGGFVHWQKNTSPQNQTCVQLQTQNDWPSLVDSIVLFNEQQKNTSSTQGHKSAYTSPLFLPRLAQVESRKKQMLAAIAQKNLGLLGPLIEADTLEMHAVMMSSAPPIFYFDQQVSEFLAWVIRTRDQGEFPAYFTLDAGPNVHLIYEQAQQALILSQLAKSPWQHNRILHAHIGEGASLCIQN